MRRGRFFFSVGVGALLVAGGLAGRSHAQTTTSQQSTATPQVAEIIVTAEKREENVNNVAMSINVVGKVQLQAYEVHDIAGLTTSIPGLSVQQSPQADGLYLRGFGTAPANPGLEQTVSVFQDGIYFGLARQMQAPFFDVDRIEVLRGPQGALVGRNTAAGAVNIITAGPTSTFDAAATGAYDFTRQGFNVDGYVSGPLTSDLSARVAVRLSDLGGYITNTGDNQKDPGERNDLVRASLRYSPSANFDITTKLEYGTTHISGSDEVALSESNPAFLPTTKNAVSGLNQDAANPTFAAASGPFQSEYANQSGYNSSTTANWKLGGFTLQSITGFSGYRSSQNTFGDVVNPVEFGLLWKEKFDQQSEELRLLSPVGGPIDFVVGAYGDHSAHDVDSFERYDLFGGFFDGEEVVDTPQSQYAWSVYGSGSWHVTSALKITGNLRYTAVNKTGSASSVLAFGAPLGLPADIPSQHIDEGHLDPAVTVQYELRPGTMVYADYSQGWLAGGFNTDVAGETPSLFLVKPETSENYEIGLKTALFDRRLELTLAAYILTFSNLQVNSYEGGAGGIGELLTSNAGSARSEGVEASFDWRVNEHLTFSGTGAYDHAVYTNFAGAPCTVFNAFSDPVVCPNNIAGYPLDYTPLWSGTLEGDYTTPLSDALNLSLSAAVHYKSSEYVDGNNYQWYGRQNPSTKVDLRVQLGDPGGKWSVALIGKDVNGDITKDYSYAFIETVAAQEDVGREILLQVSTRIR